MVAQGPGACILVYVLLDSRFVLIYQDVFSQGWDGPIELEFHSAIVQLRAGRKNFEDNNWIEKNVLLVVRKLQLSADHRNIRVGVHARGNANAKIGTKDLTLATTQLPVQLCQDTNCQTGMAR